MFVFFVVLFFALQPLVLYANDVKTDRPFVTPNAQKLLKRVHVRDSLQKGVLTSGCNALAHCIRGDSAKTSRCANAKKVAVSRGLTIVVRFKISLGVNLIMFSPSGGEFASPALLLAPPRFRQMSLPHHCFVLKCLYDSPLP